MTKIQMEKACKLYEKELSEYGYFADEYGNHLDHVMIMLSKIPTMMDSNPEKAMRWLGFVQGMLCSRQIFTIEEIKEHDK